MNHQGLLLREICPAIFFKEMIIQIDRAARIKSIMWWRRQLMNFRSHIGTIRRVCREKSKRFKRQRMFWQLWTECLNLNNQLFLIFLLLVSRWRESRSQCLYSLKINLNFKNKKAKENQINYLLWWKGCQRKLVNKKPANLIFKNKTIFKWCKKLQLNFSKANKFKVIQKKI